MTATPRSGSSSLRVERVYEEDGLRYRVLEQPRQRLPVKKLRRERMPLAAADPEALFVRLDGDYAAMAERVLREGARGWRRWRTLRERAGSDFSPLLAELELLDHLCRESGLHVEDRWRNERWVAHRFRVDRSIWPWLGILDPAIVRAELEQELTFPDLLVSLAEGPPAGFGWAAFAFVLQAAERALELERHGIKPGERELAGLVDHTKAWTPKRKQLFELLTGRQFHDLVAARDRPIEVRGPIRHSEGGLWAATIDETELEVLPERLGVLLVENRETFRHLLPLADDGWIVLHVPGGPPPAETELVERLSLLDPELAFYGCFDPDPAGIRIALLLERHAAIEIDPAGMAPELLEQAEATRELNDWDRDLLERLRGSAGVFEPLRDAIERLDAKGEQEVYQRHLLALFHNLSPRGRQAAAAAPAPGAALRKSGTVNGGAR